MSVIQINVLKKNLSLKLKADLKMSLKTASKCDQHVATKLSFPISFDLIQRMKKDPT